MNKKNIVIYLALVLLGTLFLFWVFKAPFQPKGEQKFTPTKSNVSKNKKQIVSLSESNKEKDNRFKSSYLSWGRNPFIPGGSSNISGLILKGIIWDEESPLAFINEKIVKKGDEIEGKKVIDIEKDKVIVNDGHSNFELKLQWE